MRSSWRRSGRRSGADLGFLSRQFAPRGVTAEAPRWVSLTDLPGPEAAELDTLAAGSAAGPYPAAEGWTVYQVRARRARPPRSLAEAEADIRQALFQEKFNETLDRNLAPLKAHGAVTLFPDRIREYFGEGS
jgi:hypothetical protein